MIKIGTTEILNPRRKDVDIQRVYKGTTLIFSREVEDLVYNQYTTLVKGSMIEENKKYTTLVKGSML